MRVRVAMIVWAMAATLLPVASLPAAEATPGMPNPAVEKAERAAAPAVQVENVQPAAATAPAATVESIPFDARPGGLVYSLDAPVADLRPDAFRFDFDRRPAPMTPFRLAPEAHAPRSGWAVSGRAGPLRWLTPLDGEHETQLRLGGRIPDQPKAPGLPHFNMSIHYSFE